jgi:hypothetical protein
VTAPATIGGVDVRRLPADRKAIDQFCQWLAGQDPVAAQQALCAAVSTTSGRGVADGTRLSMLVAFDRAARQACERLLVRYVEGDAQQRLMGRRSYVSALRLSESMVLAYSELLQDLRSTPAADPVRRAPDIVVRLMAFRQIDLILRMLRYKRRSASQWRALHDAFGFAMELGLHMRTVATSPSDLLPVAATTVERQYVQVLLLGAANAGQLSPREVLWACRWFGRWGQLLGLAYEERAGTGSAQSGFVVDLGGAEGPARNVAAGNGRMLHLDTTPLGAMIEEEAASLRTPGDARGEAAEAIRHARLALLGKLKVLFAPTPILVERRGQREPADSTVQVVTGLAQIVHTLRRSARQHVDAHPAASALREPTIEAFNGPTRTMTLSLGDAPVATPEVWQVRDRSDSGCRMRGKTADLNRVIPGSLLALRTSESAAWSLAVVRRLRRLMVDHIEIGVEYIGHNPRFVKVVIGERFDPSVVSLRDADPRCVGALYLPPSDAFPSMPIRTLVLPQREFRPDGCVTLLAANAIYTLRLNEPMERQMEFVVAPFAVVRKFAGEGAAHADSRVQARRPQVRDLRPRLGGG